MGKIGDFFSYSFGFTSLGEYFSTGFAADGPLTFPLLVKDRFFKTKTLQEMKEAQGGTPMKRTLGWFQLWMLGVGFMCGAGIFVSPGYIASALTGPALFLSYAVAAVSAFLSSFCYAEFTVMVPLAGAAFNYVYSTLGEAISWITVSNLILEYILANAAAVRGFAPYLARLFNKPSNFFIYNWNGYRIDGWACGVTLAVTVLLSFGIQESATTNTVITIIHIVVMLFIIIAGLTQANAANFKPFVKTGASWKDIFNGAAVAFFSFIGFDALATTAEEIKEPSRDMPLGILGAVGTVTVIYMAMCVTLSLMVPNADIDPDASFAAAFDYVGMAWAKYIVSIGALLGIFTTTLIGVMGAARILVGCCRERMLPPGMAHVGAKRQVPWVATWVVGLTSALIALFTDFAHLANMVSIGTFLVFLVVAIALLFLRCHVQGVSTAKNFWLLVLHTFALLGFALGFTLAWVLPIYGDPVEAFIDDYGVPIPEVPAGDWQGQQWIVLVVMGCCYGLTTISLWFFVKQDLIPPEYKVPAFPLIPAASIFVNTFLLGQIDVKSYERFGYWTIAAVSIYFLYGMIAQRAADNRHEKLETTIPQTESGALGHSDKELQAAADLAYVGGPKKGVSVGGEDPSL